MRGRMNNRILALGLALLLGCSSSASRSSGTGGEGGEPDTGGSTGTGGSKATGGSGGGNPTAGTGGSSKPDAASEPEPDSGSTSTGGSGGSSEPDAGGTPPKDAGVPDQGTPVAGNPFVYVGTGFTGTTIRIFQLDIGSGALSPKGMATSNSAPTYMAFHPTRKFAYALSESDPGSVVAFAVDGATGGLTRLNQAPSGGNGPAHISVHQSGKWLFAANYNSGHIAVLPIDAAGKLAAAVDVQQPVKTTAHNLRPDPAGKYVFLSTPGATPGDDKVFQYKFNEATGKLTANNPPSITGMGQGPRHLDFAPNAKNAYAIGETGGGLLSYDYDASTGLLSNPMVASIGGSQGAHVQVHPSGKFVWACDRSPGILAGFSIDASGRPKLIEKITAGLASPWDFAVEPTGKYLLVANDGGGVKVFTIDEQTGKLTAAGNGVAGGGPHFVGVMYPP
jgi:6-phosphogluconolactonase